MPPIPRLARVAGQSILFIIIGAVVLAVASPVTRGIPFDPMIVVGAATTAVMLGLSFLFATWGRCPPARAALVPDSKTFARLGIGAAIGLGLVALNTAVMMLTGHVHWQLQPVDPRRGLLLVVGFVLLACREELSYRDFPLFKLGQLSPWTAQIVVAALFAAEHVIGGARWDQALIGAGLGSLLFGWAALRSGGLALPISIHAAWNIGDWARGGKQWGGIWAPVVDHGYEQRVMAVGLVSYAVLTILATMALATGAKARAAP